MKNAFALILLLLSAGCSSDGHRGGSVTTDFPSLSAGIPGGFRIWNVRSSIEGRFEEDSAGEYFVDSLVVSIGRTKREVTVPPLYSFDVVSAVFGEFGAGQNESVMLTAGVNTSLEDSCGHILIVIVGRQGEPDVTLRPRVVTCENPSGAAR